MCYFETIKRPEGNIYDVILTDRQYTLITKAINKVISDRNYGKQYYQKRHTVAPTNNKYITCSTCNTFTFNPEHGKFKECYYCSINKIFQQSLISDDIITIPKGSIAKPPPRKRRTVSNQDTNNYNFNLQDFIKTQENDQYQLELTQDIYDKIVYAIKYYERKSRYNQLYNEKRTKSIKIFQKTYLE